MSITIINYSTVNEWKLTSESGMQKANGIETKILVRIGLNQLISYSGGVQ